jgi:hypothetical protein
VVTVFQLVFTYAPPLQFLFDTRALDPVAWLRIILVAATVLFVVELEKAVLRSRRRRSG